MSFSRSRLTSVVRALHTSASTRRPAANPTEIFQKAFGERAATQTSPLMKNEVQDNREQFKANQVRFLPISLLPIVYSWWKVHMDIKKADLFWVSQLF